MTEPAREELSLLLRELRVDPPEGDFERRLAARLAAVEDDWGRGDPARVRRLGPSRSPRWVRIVVVGSAAAAVLGAALVSVGGGGIGRGLGDALAPPAITAERLSGPLPPLPAPARGSDPAREAARDRSLPAPPDGRQAPPRHVVPAPAQLAETAQAEAARADNGSGAVREAPPRARVPLPRLDIDVVRDRSASAPERALARALPRPERPAPPPRVERPEMPSLEARDAPILRRSGPTPRQEPASAPRAVPPRPVPPAR